MGLFDKLKKCKNCGILPEATYTKEYFSFRCPGCGHSSSASTVLGIDVAVEDWNRYHAEQGQDNEHKAIKEEENNMNAQNILYKKLTETAREPFHGSEKAAGYDLFADRIDNNNPVAIHPGQTVMIKTGIAATAPDNTFLAVFPRSGLAAKYNIGLMNSVGVVDADYTGEIGVLLHNFGVDSFIVRQGDKIAQLVCMPYIPMNFVEVENLADTKRGAGGFGSTGV